MLAWYASSKRALPWRATKDPYAIWVSEVMLQQTRVETVLEYWRRFTKAFPTILALAKAREDEVLALWSGLGYYRRARALHAAAKAIVERHGGEFPRELESVRELPGVGPYTAGAVLSIAFDSPQAIVDGNVIRVLARWFAHDESYEATAKWAWEVARELVPSDGGAGAWNQALMELGATVCTPREPSCLLCPVHSLCEARKRGLENILPRARKRPAPREVELETLIAMRGDAVLMEQRPASGRMASLWQFPTREIGSNGSGTRLFEPQFTGRPAPRRASELDGELGTIRHTITSHRIRVRVVAGRPPRTTAAPLAWIERSRLDSLALTGMTVKILRAGFVDPAAHSSAAAPPTSAAARGPRTQAARAKLRSPLE